MAKAMTQERIPAGPASASTEAGVKPIAGPRIAPVAWNPGRA